MQKVQLPRSQTPPAGSGRATLLAAMFLAALILVMLRAGSGHTAESLRFSMRPEFRAWTWTYAAYAASAVTVGLATFPPFRDLATRTGRRETIVAVTTWALAVVLITLFEPGELSAHSPLWLQYVRVKAGNMICGVFSLPVVAGLLLIHKRLCALRREIPPKLAESQAGAVIVELLWLRAALLRFLVGFGVLISVGVLAVGVLRGALLADGVPVDQIPLISLLVYGAYYTGLAGLLFIPAYVAWQGQVLDLRDSLYPVPLDGRPSREWHQNRGDFDTLLSAKATPGSLFTAAFGLLAPLGSSVVAALAGIH
jgi:hypothetical protein